MANRQELQRKADISSLMEPDNGYFGKGIKLTMFPNGEKGEIWISDGRQGMCIKASKGPVGFGLTIEHFSGGMPMTVHGNLSGDLEPVVGGDFRYLSVTQYYPDERATAFKNWMACDFRTKDLDKHPELKPHYQAGKLAATEGREPCLDAPAFAAGATNAEDGKNAYLKGYWEVKAHPPKTT